jgi:hypothetical protein
MVLNNERKIKRANMKRTTPIWYFKGANMKRTTPNLHMGIEAARDLEIVMILEGFYVFNRTNYFKESKSTIGNIHGKDFFFIFNRTTKLFEKVKKYNWK